MIEQEQQSDKEPENENIFEKLKKNTEQFFTKIKENIQNLGEKIDIKLKEKKLKAFKKQTKFWRSSPQVIAMTEALKKDFKKVKKDTTQIKEDTAQIKEDTNQLLLDNAQILSLLELLNYKADNIEAVLAPIIPNLENLLDKVDNLEEYLKDRLGSKWKKLKRDWQKFKAGEITKKQFILTGFKVAGTSFAKVFTKINP